jgi:uncharacterized protein YqhQ
MASDDLKLSRADAVVDQEVEAAKELLANMIRSADGTESVKKLQRMLNDPTNRLWREPVAREIVAVFAIAGLGIAMGRTLERSV